MQIIINDPPSGASRAENDFLAAGLEMWRKGTRYVQFDRIAINLLCTQSRFVRLLQCADVVTSCVTAYVGGEHVWSPRVFAAIKPLMYSKDGRIGGYGLKFHCTRHRDLYHWLLGDSTYFAHGITYDLPIGKKQRSPETARDRNLENLFGTSGSHEAEATIQRVVTGMLSSGHTIRREFSN